MAFEKFSAEQIKYSILIFLTISLIFTNLYVSEQLSNLYTILAVMGVVLILADKKETFVHKVKTTKWNEILIRGTVLYIAWIGISFLIGNFIGTGFNAVGIGETVHPIQSINDVVYGQQIQASDVTFANLIGVTYFVWAFFIPTIESLVILALLPDFLISILGAFTKNPVSLDIKKPNIGTFIIIFGLALFWVFIHLKAKGVLDSVALAITFIFAIVTLIGVFVWKAYIEIIIMHVIGNGIAISQG